MSFGGEGVGVGRGGEVVGAGCVGLGRWGRWMMGLGNAALSLKILFQITIHFEISSTGGSS